MADALDRIVLLVPGLAGPVTDHPVSDYIERRPAALDHLCSRAVVESVPYKGMEAALGHLFGLTATDSLPVAPLSYLADSGRSPPHYLMRADPVHLRADQSRLRLFESHSFFITRDEADALVASINAFRKDQGWELSAPDPRRWYLALPAAPRLRTRSPADAAGQDVDAYLATGEDAPRWHTLLTELQMLLHDHPVNRAREQRGEPVINSLWPWGGGVLPLTVRAQVDAVYTDDALATGLARHTRIAAAAVPDGLRALLPKEPAGRRLLLVLDTLTWPAHYNDIEGWLAQLAQLETTWFAPLLAALRGGRIGTLVIEPCNGQRISTTRAEQRGFWKRTHPFEAALSA